MKTDSSVTHPADNQEMETGMHTRLKRFVPHLLVLLVLLPCTVRAAVLADLNQDGEIDLADVVIGLQVTAGLSPEVPQFAEGVDVDKDGRYGMAETLYVLQTMFAGTLPPVVLQPINDTGITWGGDYPSGNNTDCTSNIGAPQDCHQGRDETHSDLANGHGGFNYTKLDAQGNSLPASASNWSCVRDNVTGLVWEVKTDDGGIHDRDNTYRWGGKTALGTGYGTYYPDWDTLVDGSNTKHLCGFSDWRVPTRAELQGLVHYGRTNPAIDTDYFPNTPASDFWSASPYASSSSNAWYVYFSLGNALSGNRGDGNGSWSYYGHVRLVRSGQ